MLPLLRIATLMSVRYGEARWAGQPIVTGSAHVVPLPFGLHIDGRVPAYHISFSQIFR